MTHPLFIDEGTATLRPRPVPFAADLAKHGERVAVVTADAQLTYRQLASRVAEVAQRLGTTRRLVLIPASNDVGSLVCYLAGLAGGHVVLLTPPGQERTIAATYDPDVVLSPNASPPRIDERRVGSAHELHPELALLMSTSGSTGSPKLARLSHANLQSNAEAIAQYLGISDTDRAATTLPMHYCYGLSVINSHLVRGAGLIVTGLSVVDACFWDLFRTGGGTGLAGVPHTFELLERVGFAELRLPRLRYVTQAGGRLHPERVRAFAELGREWGWDLYVMYGQTEATARMAYLPPDLALSHPHTVGVPIPGGSFSIAELPGEDRPGVGELIYAGPNVMLGYATKPDDLALGRTISTLRTGDLARVTDSGLYEIVGRRSSFVKVAGLRIDLEQVESMLAGDGRTACCAGEDDRLVIAFDGTDSPEAVERLVATHCGIPRQCVHAYGVTAIPRLSSGKPDRPAVLRLARDLESAGTCPVGAPEAEPEALRELFAELLDRPDTTTDDTFVDLGGDSLSYVEVSVRLEQALGTLPVNWHTTPIRDLVPAPRNRPFRTVETSVLLRAIAIVAIVGTHAGLFSVLGGAHVLLAVAGYNFARFRLTAVTRLERVRRQCASIARVTLPSMLWIAGVVLFTGAYGPANVALLNGFLGSPTWDSRWHFWFVEILVYILVALTVLLAVPSVDRLERRFPFPTAVAVLACGLLTRFDLVGVGVPYMLPALWLFALGWAAARAASWRQRMFLSAITIATVPGFFGDASREALMIGGILLLVWAAGVPWPAFTGRVVSLLASSSLFIYLTHWQVYPHLVGVHRGLAVAVSLAVGAAAWHLYTRAGQRVSAAVHREGWLSLRR